MRTHCGTIARVLFSDYFRATSVEVARRFQPIRSANSLSQLRD